VGLVWFGLALAPGAGSAVRAESRVYSGDRTAVRRQAVAHALGLVARAAAAAGR
jgi:nicotinamide-nucleotide amidase